MTERKMLKSGSALRLRCVIPTVLAFATFLLLAAPAYAQTRGVKPPGGTGEVFGLIMLLVIVPFALTGFSLIGRALFFRRVEWTGEIVRRMPWGSFFLGLGVAVVALIFVAILSQFKPIGSILALLILAAVLFLLVGFGLTAMVEWIGEMVDPEASGFRRAILGSAAWILLLFIPILGWAIMAGLFLAGIGASLVAYAPTHEDNHEVDECDQPPGDAESEEGSPGL